jgi:hypothetical protein
VNKDYVVYEDGSRGRKPRIGTLIKKRLELKVEIAKLEAKLARVEQQVREQVPLNASDIGKTPNGWMEIKVAREAIEMLDTKKLQTLVPARTLAKCYVTKHRVCIRTKTLTDEQAYTRRLSV